MNPEQLAHAHRLRLAGCSWVQIAAEMRETYSLRPMAAIRVAHGWSQRDVADEWNRRWPDNLKTFKNFSMWEQWPAKSGYEPSLRVLARLAEMYQCAIGDLLDVGDFRHLDRHHEPEPVQDTAAVEVLAADTDAELAALDDLVDGARQWIEGLVKAVDRWQQVITDHRARVLARLRDEGPI